jgi:hypothetical protein
MPALRPWLWEKERLAHARDRRFPLTPGRDYSSDVAWLWLEEMHPFMGLQSQLRERGSVGPDRVCHRPPGTGWRSQRNTELATANAIKW